MYPRLRDLREDADMNQTQVAKYLDMSQTGYSKYETGENDIPTQVLIKLSKLYNVSVDYLLGLTDKNDKKGDRITGLLNFELNYSAGGASGAAASSAGGGATGASSAGASGAGASSAGASSRPIIT